MAKPKLKVCALASCGRVLSPLRQRKYNALYCNKWCSGVARQLRYVARKPKTVSNAVKDARPANLRYRFRLSRKVARVLEEQKEQKKALDLPPKLPSA
jgi:hypothetical protein